MPLRPDKKRLNNSNEDKPKNSSFDSCYDTMGSTRQGKEGSGDEEDPDDFLSQLGLETSMLQKINNTQVWSENRHVKNKYVLEQGFWKWGSRQDLRSNG